MLKETGSPGDTEGDVLMPALLKLVEIIEDENAVLKDNRIQFHRDFTDRKNQGLRELMAAQRSDDEGKAALACKGVLTRLSSALRVNSTLLKIHIEAVGEMSDIIICGLRGAHSDGTYSRSYQKHS